MTLLLGLNTSKGIYLAADTRLTTYSDTGTVISTEDNFLKFQTLNESVHCVVAGNARFASYLLQQMTTDFGSELSLLSFKENLKCYLQQEAGLYPYITSCPSVVFLFAGGDTSKKKSFSMEQVIEHTKLIQAKKGSVRYMPSNLTQAMAAAAFSGKVGHEIEMDEPYTGLFAVEVNVKKDGIDIVFHDAKWGEYLMFGPKGLTADKFPPDFFHMIEFMPSSPQASGEDILYNDIAKITWFFIENIVPEHELPTVGGSVVSCLVKEKGAIIPTGDVFKRNNGIDTLLSSVKITENGWHVTINGKLIKMRKLIDFYSSGKDSDLSIL